MGFEQARILPIDGTPYPPTDITSTLTNPTAKEIDLAFNKDIGGVFKEMTTVQPEVKALMASSTSKELYFVQGKKTFTQVEHKPNHLEYSGEGSLAGIGVLVGIMGVAMAAKYLKDLYTPKH